MRPPKTYLDEFVAEQEELAKHGTTTHKFAGPRRPAQLREHVLWWLGECLRHLETLYEERRTEGRSPALQHEIERLEKVTSDESGAAMLRLVGLVGLALLAGDQTVDDVIWLAELIERRLRRRWVLFVAEAVARGDKNGKLLRMKLCGSDENAEKLDAAHVSELLASYGVRRSGRTPIDSVPGLAARLAVDCGAFGYTSVAKAKAAFKKALEEKKSTHN